MAVTSPASTLLLLTLAIFILGSSASPNDGGVCALVPEGNSRDDSEQLLAAVASPDCVEILLPRPYTYTIRQRLWTNLTNKVLNVHGTLSFSDDLAYWIDNGWPVDFQNLQAAWVATGDNWVISGGGWNQGGINGNGQAWYTRAQGFINQPGRPMSLYISNASNALVKDFSVVQPQFWASFVDRSYNITLDGVYVNATNTNPGEPATGFNWTVNTDGIDTYRSDHITIQNWVIQNGDDCVAFKGNSTNIFVRNVTCYGSNGIAFGSLGQYPDRVDYVENVTVADMTLLPADMMNVTFGYPQKAAYFKAWVGVPLGGSPPNGGGGGTGLVNNITLENFRFRSVNLPLSVDSCLTYSSVNFTPYCNTSKLKFQNVLIKNFKGTSSGLDGGIVVSLKCSSAAPCHNFDFETFDVVVPAPYTAEYVCQNAINVTGIDCVTGLAGS